MIRKILLTRKIADTSAVMVGMDELLKQARAKHAVEEAYTKAFRENRRCLKPMDAETFWAIIAEFGKIIDTKRPMESNAHNLMCFAIHGSYRHTTMKDWPEDTLSRWDNMVRFLVKYTEVKATLSKKMWEMKGLERGDDGYGDLMDSLPLAGQAVVDAIMNEDIANYKQLVKAFANDDPLKKFILDGENYVEMSLENKLMEQLPSIVLNSERTEEDLFEREPDPHVVIVTSPMKVEGQSWQPTWGIQVGVVGPFKDKYQAEEFAKQNEQGGTPVKLRGGIIKR